MYSIREITDGRVWNAFIDSAEPSTFLHDFAWGDVEKDFGRAIHRFGVFGHNGNQVAAVFVFVMKAKRGNLLVCPHGPIFAKGVDGKDILSIITEELVRIGKKEMCDAVRVCSLLPNTEENNSTFKKFSFRSAPIHLYSELSWILDITPGDEDLLRGMKKNTRYGIRKAEKDGVTITSSTDVKDFELFWSIYSDTANRQAFVPFPRKYILAEFNRYAALGRATLYFAHHDGKPVSTALIIFGASSAFYHHGASFPHHSITPGELLQWTIIKDAKARGLKRYNFWGVAPDEKKGHAWAGLDRFKKGFGGYAESYVHAMDYPLSKKYMLTYVIETARRLKRRV